MAGSSALATDTSRETRRPPTAVTTKTPAPGVPRVAVRAPASVVGVAALMRGSPARAAGWRRGAPRAEAARRWRPAPESRSVAYGVRVRPAPPGEGSPDPSIGRWSSRWFLSLSRRSAGREKRCVRGGSRHIGDDHLSRDSVVPTGVGTDAHPGGRIDGGQGRPTGRSRRTRDRTGGSGGDAMTTIDTPRLDEAALEQFVHQAVGDLAAAISGLMLHLGDRLGLYRAMAGAGPVTPVELAERTGTHERYVREWLANQAAGGYLAYDAEAGTFELGA